MAEPVGALRVDVGANAAAFQEDMNRVRNAVRSTASGMQNSFAAAAGAINGAVSGMIKGVIAAAGVGGFAALVAAVKNAASAVDELGDKAEQVGVSTDFLQVLQFAAAKEGVKGLDTALDQLTHRSDELKRASGEMWDQLRRISPELANQVRMAANTEERIKLLAAAMKLATSEEQRAAISKAAFGKAGIEQTRILKNGTEGLEEYRKAAEQLGIIFDKEMIEKIAKTNKEFEVATQVIDHNFKRAIVELISPLTTVSGWIGSIADGVTRLRDQLRVTSEKSTRGLKEDLATMRELLESMSGGPQTFRSRFADLMGLSKEQVEAKIIEIEKLLAQREPPTLKIKVGEDPAIVEIYRKLTEQNIKRIAVLKAEAETQGQSTEAKEAAKLAAEVLGDAEARGIPITDQLRQKVGELAANYGRAAGEAEKAKNRFKAIEDAAKDFTSAVGDLFKGLAIEGKKLDEVLKDISKRLAGKAIDKLVELLFLGPTGNLQAGSGLLGAIFGGGRAAGGPVSAGMAYEVGERGREWFVPNTNGIIIPDRDIRGAGPAGGGLTYAPVINAPGADPAQLRRVEMALVEQGRALHQMVRQQGSAARFQRTGVQ